MIKKIALLLAITMLCTPIGCGKKPAATPSGQSGVTTIRVGYFPNVTHAQAIVGMADGTFQNILGPTVNIKSKVFNAGPAEIEAMLAGEIDLGYIGPVPAINGYTKSRGQLRILSGAANAGAVLVVREGSGINQVADLKGKRVAVPQFGNTQDIALRHLMHANSLVSTEKGGNVQVLQIENPDILTLFLKKELDAALVPEPWGTRLVKEGQGKILFDEKQLWRNGEYSTAVVIVRTNFLREYPDLVQKWMQAHVALTKRINQDPTQAKKVINQQLRILTGKALPEDLLDPAFARLIITNDPARDSVNDYAQLLWEAGYLKQKPDITDIFDLNPLNQVLAANNQPQFK